MSFALGNPWLAALGLAIFHALWEVALLGLLAWGGLFLLRRRPAKVRYAFACLGLAAMAALPAATFLLIGRLRTGPGPQVLEESYRAFLVIQDGGAGAPLLAAFRALTPWLAVAWILGVSIRLLRLGGGLWWLDRHYLAPSRPAPAPWEAKALELASRLGLRRRFRLRTSSAALSPLVIGWFKPVVLVPASAFLHLAPETLEAVLAHELAHVRRADFLLNLLQALVESLLFFHPAAWWLSGHVRELREHCCDDIAADLCGDPMALAEGLSALERLRRTLPPASEPVPGLALGAAQGNLMSRITRLFQPQDAVLPSFRGLAFTAAAAVLLGAASLAAQPPAVASVKFSQIKVLSQPQAPAYPPMAKARHITGTVVVEVTIDEQGMPTEAIPVSGPEELRPTAVDYVKGWAFAPVKRGGKAVKARFKVTMPFRLR